MYQVVYIHSNSAVAIDILVTPFKKCKNYILIAKVWSRFPNASGKKYNLPFFKPVSLQGIGFLLGWYTGVTLKRWLEDTYNHFSLLSKNHIIIIFGASIINTDTTM